MHVALLVLAAFVLAPPAAQAKRPRSFGKVVREHTREIGNSSVAVLVLHNGKRRYRKVVGQANIRRGVKATAKTNFRLASITKTMTAAAVLWLMDHRRCSPATTLYDVLPNMPKWAKSVTLAHLLSHTSGVKRYKAPRGRRRQVLDADVVEFLRGQKETDFPPGSRYRYSNTGYAVLAMVVEALSRSRFGDFLKAKLWEPLKMTSTTVYTRRGRDIQHRAYGTRKSKDGEWKVADQAMMTAILGDGGVYSNLEDMERWMLAIRERRLLSKRSWKRALTVYPTNRGRRPDLYGMGFRLHPWHDLDAISHSGTSLGFRHQYVSIPSHDVDVLVLTNVHRFDAASFAADLLAVALGK